MDLGKLLTASAEELRIQTGGSVLQAIQSADGHWMVKLDGKPIEELFVAALQKFTQTVKSETGDHLFLAGGRIEIEVSISKVPENNIRKAYRKIMGND